MSVSWRSGRNVALLEKWRQLIGHQDITLAKLIQKAVKFPAGPNRPPEAFSHLVDHRYQIALGRIARVLFCVEQETPGATARLRQENPEDPATRY